MTIKRIYLPMMFHEKSTPVSSFDYALDMAVNHHAHLTICIGVSMIIIPTDYPTTSLTNIQFEEDERRLNLAREHAEELRLKATRAGVTASTDVFQDINPAIFDHFCEAAHVHDITIMCADNDASEFQWNAMQAVLIYSGGGILLVPSNWKQGAAMKHVIVAWNDSVQASRAVRNAISFLKSSTAIEILIVVDENHNKRDAYWGNIAAYLAAHFDKVSTNEIPELDGSIGKAINNHAKLSRADLVIMGGYGHSRFREWMLGGTTRDILLEASVPVLMSH
jgi:nucleotide-binding universal stress UspA family protein